MEQFSISNNNNFSYSHTNQKISANSSNKLINNAQLTSNKLNIFYKNLPFFSKKILEAKHNIIPEIYFKIILNNLIVKKRSHYLACINEMAINTNILSEELKRYYNRRK